MGPAPQKTCIITRHDDQRIATGIRYDAGPAIGGIAAKAGDRGLSIIASEPRNQPERFLRRSGAAIDAEHLFAPLRVEPEEDREGRSFLPPLALEIDKEAALGQGLENFRQRRHLAGPLAAEGEGLAAVGRIAVADVQCLQLGHRSVLGDAAPIRPTIERPVVKHGKLAIRCQVDVEFDDVGAALHRRAHRGNRVFEIAVARRFDALGGAGVVVETFRGKNLVDAAMSEDLCIAGGGRRQKRRVEKPDDGDDDERNRGDLLHRVSSSRDGLAATMWRDDVTGWYTRVTRTGTTLLPGP